MRPGDDFKERAAAALAFANVEFAPGDLEVIELVAAAFQPAMRALDEAELAELPFEAVIDPRQPPDPAPGS